MVTEIILVGLLSLHLMLFGFILVSFLMKVLKNKRFLILYVLPFFLVVMIDYKHFKMSYELNYLKKQFHNVAEMKLSIENKQRNSVLNYENSLEFIVNTRNEILKSKGYIIFGSWWVSNGQPNTMAFYLWVPFKK